MGMTLTKAIEILTESINLPEELLDQELDDAIKLLIEAGKRVNLVREQGDLVGPGLLPGETKEYCKFCGIAHTDIECPDRGGEK